MRSDRKTNCGGFTVATWPQQAPTACLPVALAWLPAAVAHDNVAGVV